MGEVQNEWTPSGWHEPVPTAAPGARADAGSGPPRRRPPDEGDRTSMGDGAAADARVQRWVLVIAVVALLVAFVLVLSSTDANGAAACPRPPGAVLARDIPAHCAAAGVEG
jgi:hypothetical protein